MKGKKTGGRKAGTPNKSSKELSLLIEDKFPNFNPILSMIEMALDKKTDSNIRFNCLKEVTSYLFPKRKAIDLEANIQQSTLYNNNPISTNLKEKIDSLLNIYS